MNPPSNAPVPRRRIWPWLLGLFLSPFVLLALIAASFLTLSGDAAALRRRVMAATGDGWHTKVQLSVGGLTIGCVRTCLAFVHHRDLADARLALAAVQRASVGVYERPPGRGDWSRDQLLGATDQTMHRRGWSRLVGVVDHDDTVLIYGPSEFDPDDPVDLCLAVVNARELVVVSTTIDGPALAQLVERHAPAGLRPRLRLAKVKL